MLFDLYQPETTLRGCAKYALCKICAWAEKASEFPDRNTFVAHRYTCHGRFNSNVLCPVTLCRDVYASLYALGRHLSQDHQLRHEMHLQKFTNIGEFELFRHFVHLTSRCRFVMHTKYRRQVMHCAKSEHKLVLQSQKDRLPGERMRKDGVACPSAISYRVKPNNGRVDAFMQLYHVKHAPDPFTDEGEPPQQH